MTVQLPLFGVRLVFYVLTAGLRLVIKWSFGFTLSDLAGNGGCSTLALQSVSNLNLLSRWISRWFFGLCCILRCVPKPLVWAIQLIAKADSWVQPGLPLVWWVYAVSADLVILNAFLDSSSWAVRSGCVAAPFQSGDFCTTLRPACFPAASESVASCDFQFMCAVLHSPLLHLRNSVSAAAAACLRSILGFLVLPSSSISLCCVILNCGAKTLTLCIFLIAKGPDLLMSTNLLCG